MLLCAFSRCSRVSGCLAFFLLIVSLHYSARKGIIVANTPLENPVNRWVRYKDYCIRPYFYTGNQTSVRYVRSWRDSDEIVIESLPIDDPQMFESELTLLTHSSASALDADYLSKLARNWQGPISFAVYVESRKEIEHVEQAIVEAASQIAWRGNLSGVSVHLVIDKEPASIWKHGTSCRESLASLPQTKLEEVFHASYPINTIRNIARLFSNSRYFAFCDSDYIFSADFYPRMLESLSRTIYNATEKNVYYYRIFEIEKDVVQAMDYTIAKPDLRGIIETDLGREFHLRDFYESHSVPLLREWLKAPEHTDNNLFYDLPVLLRTHPYWEFQFIGTRDVPYFDENFPYRMRNNLQLRWELCRANYTLTAVHDLFVYHVLDRKAVKDDPDKKIAMREANREKFNHAMRLFNNRMRILYPSWMEKKCP